MVGNFLPKELHFGNPFSLNLCYAVPIAVSLSLGVFVLNPYLYFLCVIASLRLCIFGGTLPYIRCNDSANCAAAAISLASAALADTREPAAM